jgi:nucleoside-diphosphate-sugar epimerase
MRIFIAGATGALGRRLVPQLVERGHEVVGMTRSRSKRDDLRALGARPTVADALDAGAVRRAVAEAAPEAVVHQLTALSGEPDLRHFDRAFAATTGCAPRAPTTCSPPRARRVRPGSWPRATRAGPSRAPGAR